jgi:hypothetical protein
MDKLADLEIKLQLHEVAVSSYACKDQDKKEVVWYLLILMHIIIYDHAYHHIRPTIQCTLIKTDMD